jgi:hypothetical protein
VQLLSICAKGEKLKRRATIISNTVQSNFESDGALANQLTVCDPVVPALSGVDATLTLPEDTLQYFESGESSRDLPSNQLLAESNGDTGVASYFATPPSPMDSYIRVQRVSFHAACVHNALALGVTLSRIATHTCGDGPLPSPWCQPQPVPRGYAFEFQHREDEDDSPCTLALLTATPELSPTKNQSKHPHELYIDCLPFPDFREKLLAMQATEPKIFDEDELKLDLDFRDAFVCWGPTPWESKSWEIQTWFLKKWWMITGGESGEMANSSRWWKMMRGELA